MTCPVPLSSSRIYTETNDQYTNFHIRRRRIIHIAAGDNSYWAVSGTIIHIAEGNNSLFPLPSAIIHSFSHFPVSIYLPARLCAASTIPLSKPISFSSRIAFRVTAAPGLIW